MKSPFTGGEARLRKEQRELCFRKENFVYVAHFYECVDTKEQFTTTQLDEMNVGQVYNQYRVKYGIPFPDEIKDLRELYGLSASKMSEILGLGANQYRLYEMGEVPSEVIGKTLKSIMNPAVFSMYVRNAENQFQPQEFAKLCDKLARATKHLDDVISAENNIYTMAKRSAINGYAPQSQSRLQHVVLYFIEKLGGVFPTKMNKLLFFTDFCSYKRRAVGITGLAYKAIQYGPVPERWDMLYGSMDAVEPEIVPFASGHSGELLVSKHSPDMSLFSQEEMAIMDEVIHKLGSKTANQLSEMSHQEDAWLRFKDASALIDYTAAFSLKAL